MGILNKIYNRLKKPFHKGFLNIENRDLKTLISGNKRTIVFGTSETINEIDVKKYTQDFIITVGNFYEHPDIEILQPDVHIFAASHTPITDEVLSNWYKRCDERLPKDCSVLIEQRDALIARTCFKNRKIYIYKYERKTI